MRTTLAAFAFLAATQAVATTATMDFARRDEFESAKISPNGDYLAVAVPDADRTALGILDIKTRRLSAALTFRKGEHVSDYRWVNPTRVVVSIARREGSLDKPRATGELYGINADGSDEKYLFGYRGERQVGSHRRQVNQEFASAFMVDAAPDNPDRILVSIWSWRRADGTPPMLASLNVHNGVRTRLGEVPARPPIHVAADATGVPRFAFGHDKDNEILLFARDGAEADWQPVATPPGSLEGLRLFDLSADGSTAYFAAFERNGRSCLREYRFKTRAIRDLSCRQGVDIERVEFSFDKSRPVAVRYASDRNTTEAVPPEHPDYKVMRQLDASFPGQRVTITSRTLDGRRLVLFVDSGQNPGDFYLFDRNANKAEYLISRRSWIDPQTMAPVSPIRYRARDGTPIDGYLTAPQGLQSRKAPMVVLPHGGPHGVRDNWEWSAWPQFLASKGYAVLQPNFRGSGGYGKAFEEAGYRRWGTLMQDDITDAVHWAIARGIADPGRICIFGASYGGYAALMGAVREPDLYRCTAGFAGVYDLALQQDSTETRDTLYGRNYLKEVLGPDEKDWLAQSPVTHLARLKAPVLIAHGTADRRVPFSQAKRLREELARHRKPFEWREYADEEHGFFKDENEADFLDRLAAFLDRHIGRKSGSEHN